MEIQIHVMYWKGALSRQGMREVGWGRGGTEAGGSLSQGPASA